MPDSGARTGIRLVLFAHGSRDPNWRAPFEQLRRDLIEDLGEAAVRLCYLEFEPPGLDEVLAEAAEDQVERVRILPLFIAAGKHVREDLPNLVEQATRAHPAMAIELLPTLGEDPRFVALMRGVALDAAARPQLEEPT